MPERLMLSVQVGYKVLGAFRQVHYGLKVNDFGSGSALVAESGGKQLQYPAVGLDRFVRQLSADVCHAAKLKILFGSA